MNLGIRISMGMAGMPLSGERAPAGAGNSYTATVDDFTLADNIFDIGAAFGRATAQVPVSGTTDVPVGGVVTVRAWSASGVSAWQPVEVTAPGVWSGTLSVPHVAGSPWSYVEARAVGSDQPAARATTRFATGHVIGMLGQSELDRTFVSGGSDNAYGGTLSDPEQTQTIRGEATLIGGATSNVAGFALSRDFAGTTGHTPIWQHGADMIQKNTTDKVMIIDLSQAGTGVYMLTDDSNGRRRWSDFEAMLDAAGWQDGVRPGLLVMPWAVTDAEYALDYVTMIRPAFTGLDDTGAAYVPGTGYTVEEYSGSGTLTVRHDHLLFDLTGQGRGKFNTSETRVALCLQRFDPYIGDHANALTLVTGALEDEMAAREVIRTQHEVILADPQLSQVFTRGTEPMNYENGSLIGVWSDHLHPGQTPDGLELFARHLTHAGLRGMRLVPQTVPEFDTVAYDPGGAYADFSWSGGAITTTRRLRGTADLDDTHDHWTDVLGFEFNDTPASRAELRPDGSVRVHVPAALAPANWARDRFFFGRGGGGGTLLQQDDPLGQGWLNYPVVDADAAGVSGLYDNQLQSAGGIAVRPRLSPALLPAAYRSAALRLNRTGFLDPRTIQEAAGGNATQLRVEMRIAFDHVRGLTRLASVGTRLVCQLNQDLQGRVNIWAGGGNPTTPGAVMIPHVRYDVTLAVDMVANTLRLDIDGIPALSHSIRGGVNKFVNADRIALLDADASGFEFEHARVWVNDLAGAGTPYKTLLGASGAAALAADPWRGGTGTIHPL